MPSLSIDDQRSLHIDDMFQPWPSSFGQGVVVRYPASNTVLQASYDPATSMMWVWLPEDRGPYPYFDVSREVFEEMCADESPGIYYNRNIRGRYLPS